MAKELKDLTKRSENYSQWYNDLVVKADLAEQSPVRGCMSSTYGYAIWEKCNAYWTICSSNRTRKCILPVAYPEIIPEP